MSISSSGLEKASEEITFGDLVRSLLWTDAPPAHQSTRIGVKRSSLSMIMRLFNPKITVHPIAFDFGSKDNRTFFFVDGSSSIHRDDYVVMRPFAYITPSKDRLFVRENKQYVEVTYGTIEAHLSPLQCDLLIAYLKNDTGSLERLDDEARQAAMSGIQFGFVYE